MLRRRRFPAPWLHTAMAHEYCARKAKVWGGVLVACILQLTRDASGSQLGAAWSP